MTSLNKQRKAKKSFNAYALKKGKGSRCKGLDFYTQQDRKHWNKVLKEQVV